MAPFTCTTLSNVLLSFSQDQSWVRCRPGQDGPALIVPVIQARFQSESDHPSRRRRSRPGSTALLDVPVEPRLRERPQPFGRAVSRVGLDEIAESRAEIGFSFAMTATASEARTIDAAQAALADAGADSTHTSAATPSPKFVVRLPLGNQPAFLRQILVGVIPGTTAGGGQEQHAKHSALGYQQRFLFHVLVPFVGRISRSEFRFPGLGLLQPNSSVCWG
jgi:hypothetical protein